VDQGEQAEGKSKEEGIRTPTRVKEGLVGTSRSSATLFEGNFFISSGMDYNRARIKPTIFLGNL
jgi:hypothetical protein